MRLLDANDGIRRPAGLFGKPLDDRVGEGVERVRMR
jgi:hypothetical protein